jgi:hypothetical protein
VITGLPDETGYDKIAVESGTEVFRSNEEIPRSGFAEHMARSSGMDLETACEEIRRLGNDVMIAPHPHDPPGPLQDGKAGTDGFLTLGTTSESTNDRRNGKRFLGKHSQEPIVLGVPVPAHITPLDRAPIPTFIPTLITTCASALTASIMPALTSAFRGRRGTLASCGMRPRKGLRTGLGTFASGGFTFGAFRGFPV